MLAADADQATDVLVFRAQPPVEKAKAVLFASRIEIRTATVSRFIAGAFARSVLPDPNPAGGRSPTIAHDLVRDAIADLARRQFDEEINAAAVIAGEATDAICDNILLAPLDLS